MSRKIKEAILRWYPCAWCNWPIPDDQQSCPNCAQGTKK